jgi:glycerol-3-phosphate dehydrogenase
MAIYETLCAGQNNCLQDPAKKVPRGRFVSKQEICELIPGLNADPITGGILFYESHMHSSERMTLGFLDTAVKHGATAANYVEVTKLLTHDNRSIRGVVARDVLTGTEFDIRASVVLNAAGPWIPKLNRTADQARGTDRIVNALSKGAHIIAPSLTQEHAVALPTIKKTQAVISRGGRHVFILPWRGYSLIGTTYGPYEGDIDNVRANEEDVQEMMTDINSALGNEVLRREDVLHAYAGLYPLIDDFINPKVYQGTGKYQIIDHSATDGLDGLVSVLGAKFTTARLLAEKAIDAVAGRFNKGLDRCKTREIRLASGDIDDIQSYRKEKAAQYCSLLPESVIDNLITNYGADIDRVLEPCAADRELGEVLADERTSLAAEVVHAARNEMACHLDDFIFRRTGLGTVGNPGVEVLRRCAELMGNELEWSETKKETEVARALEGFICQVSPG